MTDVRERIAQVVADHWSIRPGVAISGYDLKAARKILAIVGEWRPIETAPADDVHFRGMWTNVNDPAGSYPVWFSVAGVVAEDEDDFLDEYGDSCGYPASEFTHWMPRPTPPEPPQ